jgi:hypothetical protein
MNKVLYNIIFFLLFFLLVDLYFWQAFKSNFLFVLKSNSLAKWLYWLIAFSCVPLMAYAMFNYQNPDSPKYLILVRAIIVSIYVAKILACIPLLLDDLLRIIRCVIHLFLPSNSLNGRPISRLGFLKNLSFLIGSIMLSLMSWGIIHGRFNFKKHRIPIRIAKWPSILKGLKIVHISDLHLGTFSSTQPIIDVVNLINEENPDLIFFTGDIINNSYWEADEFIPHLAKLDSKYGKYSILGNHDYGDYLGIDKTTDKGKELWDSNFSKMTDIHKNIGFDLLLNEHIEIFIKGCSFNLIGVENWGAGGFSKYGDLNKSVENANSSLPSILLSHDPSHWENQVLNNSFPIDLQLSGHTHGMQFGIELGNFKWSPAQFKYTQWAGLYNKNNQQIYVNRGIGHLGYAGRVGIYPEISILEIS